MAPFVFGLEKLQGLLLGQAPGGLGMMVQHEIGKGLADDHADLARLA